MTSVQSSDPIAVTAAERLSRTESAYKDRHQTFSKKAEEFEAKSARIGNWRGLSFAVFAVSFGVFLSKGIPLAGVLALFSVLLFAWLVQHHGKILELEAHQRRYAIVNEHALLRLTGKWHNLPRAGISFAPKDHGYSEDLDLFGTGSVYQRISVAHTRYGQTTLAAWLSEPASLEEIHARQAAVLELSPLLEFRQSLEAEGMALVEKKRGKVGQLTDGPNPLRLLSWVTAPPKIASNLPVLVLSWLLPIATLSGIVAHSFFDKTPLAWIVPLVLGLGLLNLTKEACAETFGAVSTTEGAFLRYGALLSILESLNPTSPWLKSRIEKLLSQNRARPSEVMRRFRTLVSWFDVRYNGMAYPFINAIFLWDIHCTRALENWKKDVGGDLSRWFEVIGDVEALSSLAALYADDPGASMPRVVDAQSGTGLSAEGLGHPLLAARGRVTNHVDEVKTGQALLVTGSNMSGKSTFLRALGVNAVLAFAGGPVIAKSLELPLCRLGTSIRVSDSLKSGVSHFYAEVQKLALVVKTSEDRTLPVLFLLDEVLHGTNSRERQIGARWVLAELLQKGAFGVITTHDMELCRLPDELMTRVRQHHFRELVKDGEMTFDYTLRQGPVTSGNALRLMQKVGLNVPLEKEPTEEVAP